MNFILSNWQTIVNITMAAVAVCTSICALTPSKKDDEILAKVKNWANWLSLVNPKAHS